jgi:hypothetical protein
VFFMGRYELQLLDSYENPTYPDGQCGALYGQVPPLVNACRKPGEWQSYDVVFTAPRLRGREARAARDADGAPERRCLVQDPLGADRRDGAPRRRDVRGART